MDYATLKNEKVNKTEEAYKETKVSDESSSDSSGIESLSDARVESPTDTKSFSYSDTEAESLTFKSLSNCDESTASCSKSEAKEQVEKKDEPSKNYEEEEEKAVMIAKLLNTYKSLSRLHLELADAKKKNDTLKQENEKTTDYMMNLMEGSSVTESMHLFLRRKTKWPK